MGKVLPLLTQVAPTHVRGKRILLVVPNNFLCNRSKRYFSSQSSNKIKKFKLKS